MAFIADFHSHDDHDRDVDSDQDSDVDSDSESDDHVRGRRKEKKHGGIIHDRFKGIMGGAIIDNGSVSSATSPDPLAVATSSNSLAVATSPDSLARRQHQRAWQLFLTATSEGNVVVVTCICMYVQV